MSQKGYYACFLMNFQEDILKKNTFLKNEIKKYVNLHLFQYFIFDGLMSQKDYLTHFPHKTLKILRFIYVE